MFVLLWQLAKKIAVWVMQLMESGFFQVFLQFPFFWLNDLSFTLCYIFHEEGQPGAELSCFWLFPPSVGTWFWISVLQPTSNSQKNLEITLFSRHLQDPSPSKCSKLSNNVIRHFWLGRGLGSWRGQAAIAQGFFAHSTEVEVSPWKPVL